MDLIFWFVRIVSQGFTQPNLEECKRIIDNAAVDNAAKEFLTVDNKKCTYILPRNIYVHRSDPEFC